MAETTPIQNFNEIGSTGLNQWGGYVKEDFLRELQGPRGMQILREMSENDDVAGACLYAIEFFARQVDWRFEATEEAGASGEERAKFLSGALFEDMNLPWSDTVAEILSMLVYGYSMFEIVYKRRIGPENADASKRSKFTDGQIGWRKWAPRAQTTIERWQFDPAGGIEGCFQTSNPNQLLPIQKCLLFRTTTRKGNPEGRSILRNAYRTWHFKRRVQEIEGIGIERDLAGLPVITVPKTINVYDANNPSGTQAFNVAKNIVTAIRRDEQEGVVLPEDWKLELLGSTSKRQFDTNTVITRYDQRIAMTMLADFILVGHDAVGSKALNQTKLRGFTLAMTTFLDIVRDVINRIAVPRLYQMNGWPLDEEIPQLVHGEVEEIDLAALGEFLKAVSTAGMPLFPEPMLQKHLLGVAKLPVPPDDQLPTVPELPEENPDDEDEPGDETPPPAKKKKPVKKARRARPPRKV